MSAACNAALARGVHLREVLLHDASITEHLSSDEIESALDPEQYIGSAERIVDNVLAEAARVA